MKNEPGYLHLNHAEAAIMVLDICDECKTKVFDSLRRLNDEERAERGLQPIAAGVDFTDMGDVARHKKQPMVESPQPSGATPRIWSTMPETQLS